MKPTFRRLFFPNFLTNRTVLLLGRRIAGLPEGGDIPRVPACHYWSQSLAQLSCCAIEDLVRDRFCVPETFQSLFAKSTSWLKKTQQLKLSECELCYPSFLITSFVCVLKRNPSSAVISLEQRSSEQPKRDNMASCSRNRFGKYFLFSWLFTTYYCAVHSVKSMYCICDLKLCTWQPPLESFNR